MRVLTVSARGVRSVGGGERPAGGLPGAGDAGVMPALAAGFLPQPAGEIDARPERAEKASESGGSRPSALAGRRGCGRVVAGGR